MTDFLLEMWLSNELYDIMVMCFVYRRSHNEDLQGIPNSDTDITFPYAKVCNVFSHKNAQCFGGTAWFPLRFEMCWALFGNFSGLETILSFCSVDVAPELRGN
jgi:hypothetical protein